MTGPGPRLRRRIAALVGSEVAMAHEPPGGFTVAGRWVVGLADGRSAFVKVGTTPDTAEWLRSEHHWCTRIGGRFMPEVVAFDDGEEPIVVFEDLSTAHWPPPWRDGDLVRVVDTLAEVASAAPDAALAPLEDASHWSEGWGDVARDPGPLLSLRLASPAWLEGALPELIAAAAAAPLSGTALVHADVRSDNLCILEDRVVLVDWNLPHRGNATFDLAALAPSLRLEGGPLPDELVPDQPELAALLAGYFCQRAGLPTIPQAPRVRRFQERQARVALPWAARALGLPPPDGDYARHRLAGLDRRLAAREITEPQWHDLVEEVLGDAYLSSDDPPAGSGKSGGAVEWRWARELTLDAVPPRDGPVHLLDVGCANGHLMESLVAWGAERSVTIEPYGVEISRRLADVARRRLPRWRDRIWHGNALDWEAPRTFDVVNLALDCAPPGRGRELISRAMGWLAPGGRLTFRPDRVKGGTSVEALRELGIEPDGVLETPHPEGTGVRRMAYLERRAV